MSTRRRVLLTAIGVVAVAGFAYYVIPQITGLGGTLKRLRSGDPRWLALAVILEAFSLAGDVGLFRAVFATPSGRIGWRASSQIVLAGSVATKVFASAGAGGLALTAWALRASGMSSQTVAERGVCFEIIDYAVYMGALVIGGFGLWFGAFQGRAPVGLTLVPALVALGVVVTVASMRWIAPRAQRALSARAARAAGRRAVRLRRAAKVPAALVTGVASASELLRKDRRPLLAAIAAWAFDIGALWASFRAFGHPPPVAPLVVGYFVGTAANTLPLPGGVGGVEGGLIGAFVGFGVGGSLAVLAVLAYRTISYWLPTAPGAIAYARLRRTVARWRTHPAQAAP